MLQRNVSISKYIVCAFGSHLSTCNIYLVSSALYYTDMSSNILPYYAAMAKTYLWTASYSHPVRFSTGYVQSAPATSGQVQLQIFSQVNPFPSRISQDQLHSSCDQQCPSIGQLTLHQLQPHLLYVDIQPGQAISSKDHP